MILILFVQVLRFPPPPQYNGGEWKCIFGTTGIEKKLHLKCNCNMSFHNQCPHYSEQSTNHTMSSFCWNDFLLKKKAWWKPVLWIIQSNEDTVSVKRTKNSIEVHCIGMEEEISKLDILKPGQIKPKTFCMNRHHWVRKQFFHYLWLYHYIKRKVPDVLPITSSSHICLYGKFGIFTRI